MRIAQISAAMAVVGTLGAAFVKAGIYGALVALALIGLAGVLFAPVMMAAKKLLDEDEEDWL